MIQYYTNTTGGVIYWIGLNNDNTYSSHGFLDNGLEMAYPYDSIQTFSDYEEYKTELLTHDIILED
jgi:hypothetical protein